METRYLAYDIECTKANTLVLFKTLDNEIFHIIWINGEESKISQEDLDKLYEIVENYTLIGYNNHWYDDCMLDVIRLCKQKAIKRANDSIISGQRRKPWNLIKSLDMMQQIDVSVPSLKQIEGNMGKSIVESSISFDIDRELTESERQEMLDYCSYDVESTISIYKLRQRSYFESRDMILDMLNLPNAFNWNTTTIVANILVPDKKRYHQSAKLLVPGWMWECTDGIPKRVWDMWNEGNKSQDHIKGLKETVMAFDNEFVFGFGGLHAAPKEKIDVRNVKLLDVGSMYPSIIINLNALGDMTSVYDDIRRERLSIKHSDPTRANALKLILNSTYGLLKNRHSLLFNPKASSSVCIYGQIALFVLCEMLDAQGYKIINVNTDGVAFIDDPKLNDSYKTIWHDWESNFDLTLELDEFERWIQKDVNNYIAIRKDGKLKLKGGDVNKYDTDKYFSNNNIRIVQKALVEYLVNGTSPFMTIHSNTNNPLLYQYVLKAGRTYLGVYDQNGHHLQNVNRVFALDGKYDGTKLYKVRQDGGRVNFPDVPDNMWLFNGDLEDMDINEFKRKLDLSHYVRLANKKIKEWR